MQCRAAGEGRPGYHRSQSDKESRQRRESLCEAVGLFFVNLLKTMRDNGHFHAIPQARECYTGVASYDGMYGWPVYEDRGPENML